MQPTRATRRHSYLAHRWQSPMQRSPEPGRNRLRTEQNVFARIAWKHALENGVPAPGHVREGYDMACAITLVHTMKLADRTFLDSLVGMKHTFQNDLAVRRHGKIDAVARHHLERLAEQGSGDFKLIVPEPQIEAGCQQDCGMITQRHGDLQPLAAHLCGARQGGEMVVRCNADERAVRAEGLQTCDREIPVPRDGVPGNDRTCGNVGSGLVLEERRDRQGGQIRIGQDNLLARCMADNNPRCERAAHGIDEPGLQPIRCDAQRPCRLRPCRQVIAGHGHGVPGDVFEHHRAPPIEK